MTGRCSTPCTSCCQCTEQVRPTEQQISVYRAASVTHPMTPPADLPYAKAKPTAHHRMAASMTSKRFLSRMLRTFLARPLPVSTARKPTCMKNTRNLQAISSKQLVVTFVCCAHQERCCRDLSEHAALAKRALRCEHMHVLWMGEPVVQLYRVQQQARYWSNPTQCKSGYQTCSAS